MALQYVIRIEDEEITESTVQKMEPWQVKQVCSFLDNERDLRRLQQWIKGNVVLEAYIERLIDLT